MLVAAFPLATALSYAAPFRAPPLLRAPARAAVLMQSVTPADQSPVKQFTGLMRGDLSFQAVRTGADVDTPGLAICSPDDCTTVVPAEVVHTAKVGSYFGLWFALSIGYAVCNKRVTNALPLPWCVATSTVLVGSVFVTALWKLGLRETPGLTRKQLLGFLPIGTFHAIGHAAGTLGTTYGSVSFAQVVKAAGPVYACALSAFVLRQAVSARVWLTLLPIIGGVGLATMKELSFAWGALGGAVISDLALALRNVYSKQRMNKPPEERGELSPANMFGVLTVLSAAVSLPFALAIEGRAAPAAWATAVATVPGGAAFLSAQICAAGLFFYGYSEVAMQALANVHPVTHAIGNTMRRVVIMVVSMLVFRTPMTPLGAAGSAMAIIGAFTYAMVRNQEKMAEKEAELDVKVEEALPLHLNTPRAPSDAAAAPDWGDACDPWMPTAACILGPLDSLFGGRLGPLLPGFLRPAPEQP